MAFAKHPNFNSPSTDARIWRFMDLGEFLSLLDSGSLYFTRLDQFSTTDPFEGFYTKLNLRFEVSSFEADPEAWQKMGIDSPEFFKIVVENLKRGREMVRQHRAVTFVNCWHLNDYEPAAMWWLYMQTNEGIAVQSTYARLITSLEGYGDFEVYVGTVKYIDYTRDEIPYGNLIAPFTYKRKSFEHERELRALIWTPQYGKNSLFDPNENKYKNTLGMAVPVSLHDLIEAIYIDPSAPKMLQPLLANVLKKYGLPKEVRQSDLGSAPFY